MKENRLGKRHSEETKNKMSVFRKGKIQVPKHSEETKNKISIKLKGRSPWNKGKTNCYSKETKKKWSTSRTGRILSEETKQKISESGSVNIQYLQKKYPIFCKIEWIEETTKPRKFKVHCKNHKCKNSKEQGGYFIADYSQISERIRQLENPNGNEGSYLYCSDECKQECPLFNLQVDPYRKIFKKYLYKKGEYNIWRQEVLKRADYICEYCEQPATHAHHSRPQKLEPIFILDPDYGIACCQECHYKYGHKKGTECSTGNLAKIICN
jgi:hypothetical protein